MNVHINVLHSKIASYVQVIFKYRFTNSICICCIVLLILHALEINYEK